MENRVRPDVWSATNKDLRTSASSRSKVTNLSPVFATAWAPSTSNPPAKTELCGEQNLLIGTEQVEGPLHGGTQRLMALEPSPRAHEETESVVEVVA